MAENEKRRRSEVKSELRAQRKADKKGYVATTKFLIASPTKVRPVAHVVSRRNCTEALAILDNMPQKGASLIKNTLKSAIANAFDLGMACPECGWNGWVTQRGWKVRSDALKATQEEDAGVLKEVKLVHPDFHAADLRDLLRSLGVPEEELALPPLEHKVNRTELPDGTVILDDPDGGSVVISTDRRITFRNWDGPRGLIEKEIDRLTDCGKQSSDGE